MVRVEARLGSFYWTETRNVARGLAANSVNPDWAVQSDAICRGLINFMLRLLVKVPTHCVNALCNEMFSLGNFQSLKSLTMPCG